MLDECPNVENNHGESHSRGQYDEGYPFWRVSFFKDFTKRWLTFGHSWEIVGLIRIGNIKRIIALIDLVI